MCFRRPALLLAMAVSLACAGCGKAVNIPGDNPEETPSPASLDSSTTTVASQSADVAALALAADASPARPDGEDARTAPEAAAGGRSALTIERGLALETRGLVARIGDDLGFPGGSAAFSADGSVVVVRVDEVTIAFHDGHDGRFLGSVVTDARSLDLTGVAISPTGTYVAVVSPERAGVVFDRADLRTVGIIKRAAHEVAFIDDDNLLLLAHGFNVVVGRDGTEKAEVRSGIPANRARSLLRLGDAAYVAWDDQIQAIDPRTARWLGEPRLLPHATCTPRGPFIQDVSQEGRITVTDLRRGSERAFAAPKGGAFDCFALVPTGDGDALFGIRETPLEGAEQQQTDLMRLGATSARALARGRGDGPSVAMLALSDDDRRIAVVAERGLMVLSVEAGARVRSLAAITAKPKVFRSFGDASLARIAGNELEVIGLDTGRRDVAELPADFQVPQVAWTRDGAWLLITGLKRLDEDRAQLAFAWYDVGKHRLGAIQSLRYRYADETHGRENVPGGMLEMVPHKPTASAVGIGIETDAGFVQMRPGAGVAEVLDASPEEATGDATEPSATVRCGPHHSRTSKSSDGRDLKVELDSLIVVGANGGAQIELELPVVTHSCDAFWHVTGDSQGRWVFVWHDEVAPRDAFLVPLTPDLRRPGTTSVPFRPGPGPIDDAFVRPDGRLVTLGPGNAAVWDVEKMLAR